MYSIHLNTDYWAENLIQNYYRLCSRTAQLLNFLAIRLGDRSVSYLNTRVRFNWNEVDFSIFSTYQMIISVAGNFFY